MSTVNPSALAAWRQPRVRLAVGAFAGVLIGLLLAVTIGGTPWRDYVRRQPPAVVALSFADPAGLPVAAAPDGSVRFSFEIKNRQDRSYDASYTTVVVDTVTKAQRTVRSGALTVAAGDTMSVEGQATVTGSHRQQVLVRLASGQSIDFYVTPRSKPAAGS